jgi:hypothetical protein
MRLYESRETKLIHFTYLILIENSTKQHHKRTYQHVKNSRDNRRKL